MLVYAMDTDQSAAFAKGGAAATQVQEQIATQIHAGGCVEDVVVVTNSGVVAYCLWLCWRPLTSAND